MTNAQRPSPSQTVRTLLSGLLPGRLHHLTVDDPFDIWHVADSDGDLLVLAKEADARQLLNAAADSAALEVTDIPPLPGGPSRGVAWLTGWLEELDEDEEHKAALEFAVLRPLGLLLDVGRGYTVMRLRAVDVWLERDDAPNAIDLDDYRRAMPDPLRWIETETVTHLDLCHREAILAAARRELSGITQARPTRLDCHGLEIWCAMHSWAGYARLNFPWKLTSDEELSTALSMLLGEYSPDSYSRLIMG